MPNRLHLYQNTENINCMCWLKIFLFRWCLMNIMIKNANNDGSGVGSVRPISRFALSPFTIIIVSPIILASNPVCTYLIFLNLCLIFFYIYFQVSLIDFTIFKFLYLFKIESKYRPSRQRSTCMHQNRMLWVVVLAKICNIK